MRTFSSRDDRREHLDLRALGIFQNSVRHLFDRLRGNFNAVNRADRLSDSGKQQPEIIIDFRHRSDCRPGVPARRFLIDADRRRQAFDRIDVGFVHLS